MNNAKSSNRLFILTLYKMIKQTFYLIYGKVFYNYIS